MSGSHRQLMAVEDKEKLPEKNNPVVASFPEPSGRFPPVWIMLVLEHHICDLWEGTCT